MRFVNTFCKMAKIFLPKKMRRGATNNKNLCKTADVTDLAEVCFKDYAPKPRSLYAAASVFAFSMT